jgi:serine/threonine protein kinase
VTSDSAWRRISQLYHDALAHHEAERAAFLQRACGADTTLRREVESLLVNESQASGFLSEPALGLAAKKAAGEGYFTDRELETGDSGLNLVGRQLGSYAILSLLGAGGMGEVYRARDTTLGRDVALKILPESVTHDAERLTRLHREAQVLAALNHPHIGAIYGVGEVDGQQFLILELIEGETLADRLAKRPPTIAQALRIAKQIAEGLEAAHQKGIIHRDLKPANIALTVDDHVKVLDFGLAKVVVEPTGDDLATSQIVTSPAMLSAVGVTPGTVSYMSPEQTEGVPNSLGPASDIYTLGAITYELLAGRLPYDLTGKTNQQAFTIIRHQAPARLTHLHWCLRGDVESVVRKALEKDKAKRYQSPREFAEDLSRLLRSEPISAKARNSWVKLLRWSLQEERIGQLGLAQAFLYGVLSLVHVFWALVPETTPEVNGVRLSIYMMVSAVVMAIMAWLSCLVAQKRVRPMWFALAGSMGLFIFSGLVLMDVVSYDAAGGLRDPGAKWLVFMLETPLALLSVLLNVLALTVFFFLQHWEKPAYTTATASDNASKELSDRVRKPLSRTSEPQAR